MPLASKSRLGPYEIITPLGAGGMGEVYRARDTRLDRDVAVKVLRPGLAADEDAMARFEREARTVAALSHPNIIALYDVGREGTTAYVVTELLGGVTLRERLGQGRIPVRKAIDYAKQIAAGLAASHERGIVHRDLKPENIVITADGRLKILDFGIAHIVPSPGLDTDGATLAVTAPGLVFGTVGYMAPEQARGLPVDARTDIFALGAILYEMLTGRRAFGGATPADTLAALLKGDVPPLSEDPGSASVELERVLHRCLEAEPKSRFQSADDLAFALDLVPAGASGASPHGRTSAGANRWRAIAVATTLLLVAGAVATFVRRADVVVEPPRLPVRFGIAASMTWSDAASVSPDGQYIVYTGGASQPTQTAAAGAESGARPAGFAPASGRFWLRRVDELQAQRLSDTEAAVPLFFWSPDSRLLGYRAGNTLVIRELPNGAPRVFAELPASPQSVAWSREGTLLIGMSGGIYRIPSAGGTPVLVLRTEPDREIWRGSPAFLPGGERFLFTVLRNGAGEQALETRVASLDGTELGSVVQGVVGATYVDGHLLFGAGGSLFAQPFDLDRLALTGERMRLAQSVAQDWRSGRLAVGASDAGVLVLRGAPRGDAQFTLVDRFGRVVRTIGAPDSFTNFSVSPDERRIISARRDPLTGQISLWLIDALRGVTSLITPADDREDVDDPTWAPDGQHVAYRHGARLVMRLANGGPERTLVDAEAYPDAFSPDGRFLAYGQPRENAFEQWMLDITTPGAKPISVVTGVTLADELRFSPNGRWVAYHSNETRTPQIYVIPFPSTGQKWQISQAGGVQPRWSPDGSQLFFLDPDGRLMSATLPQSDPRGASTPAVLFASGVAPSDALDQYAPLRDGFLIRMPLSVASEDAAVQVVINWKPH
jgi:Tol biopolymer transport system component